MSYLTYDFLGNPINLDEVPIPTTPPVSELVPYTNPAGDEYPVIAYNNVKLSTLPDWDSKDSESIKKFLETVAACGFNVNIWSESNYYSNYNLRGKYLQAASDLNLKSIVNVMWDMPKVHYNDKDAFGLLYEHTPMVENITTKGNPIVDKLFNVFEVFNASENVWGYLLTDQPGYVNWLTPICRIPEGEIDLPWAYKLYFNHRNSGSNGKLAYFNLIVSTDEDAIGPADPDLGDNPPKNKLYYSYLEAIRKRFVPVFMSADIYPVIQFGASGTPDIKNEYYYMIEAIGRFSKNKGIPFWLYLLSNQHTIYNEDGSIRGLYPKPTEAILRFQAMTALAYGIKGLVFWSYGLFPTQKYSNGSTYIEYIDAPYKNGISNPIWSSCQSVISDIKFFGKVLLKAKFDEAQHVYGDGEKAFSETKTFSGKFGCISRATADGKGFVITHLQKLSNRKNPTTGKTEVVGIHYYAVVSHDFQNSQQISLIISDTYDNCSLLRPTGKPLNYYTHLKVSNGVDCKNISGTLNAGEMFLIKYEVVTSLDTRPGV